jgi:hypothetical protein
MTRAVKRPDRIKDLPKHFDGRDVWSTYLSKIRNQGACGNCWAIASTTVLADRYAIYSLNQINTELTAMNATVCSEVITGTPEFDDKVISQKNLRGHSIAACNGNTIYASMRFLYVYGAMEKYCSSPVFLASRNLKDYNQFHSLEDIPTCQSLYGKTFDQCVAGNIAARYFRAKGSYTIPDKVELIKEDIYQFGPNISGFIIFSDFIDNYDGKTIYMGPGKDAIAQGGHAIRVVGWGEEDVNGKTIPYWWIANSWGEEWGLGGYFKMAMNIKECELEKNFAGLIPDIAGLKLPNYVFFEDTVEDVEKRRAFAVNNDNGYLLSAERKIYIGELKGNIRPLIKDKDKLIDLSKLNAADVPAYVGLYQSKVFFTVDESNFVKIIDYRYVMMMWLIVFIIFLLFLLKKQV